MEIKLILERIGIHLHTWFYFDDDMQRKCKCGLEQEYICVPSTPSAFCSWMDK